MTYIDPNSGAAPQPGAVFRGSEPEPELVEEVLEEVEDESEENEDENSDLNEGAEGESEEEGEEEESEDSDEELEGDDDEEDDEQSDFDPSDHGIPEVLAYLEENPDDRDAVLALERAGKARKGILGD